MVKLEQNQILKAKQNRLMQAKSSPQYKLSGVNQCDQSNPFLLGSSSWPTFQLPNKTLRLKLHQRQQTKDENGWFCFPGQPTKNHCDVITASRRTLGTELRWFYQGALEDRLAGQTCVSDTSYLASHLTHGSRGLTWQLGLYSAALKGTLTACPSV